MTVDSGQPMGGVSGLKVALKTHVHGVVVAAVSGHLDISSTQLLDAELSLALTAGPCRTLVLDLSAVDALDSTGLRALWTIRHTMREVGGQLVLRQPSRTVLHVLDAAGLTAMFEVG